MKLSERLKKVHGIIVNALIQIANFAATRPKLVLFFVPVFSISIFFVGLYTNFYMETDEVALWTPSSSNSLEQNDWLRTESGISVGDGTMLQILIHRYGGNVLEMEGIEYAFKVVHAVRSEKLCNASSITGVLDFFDNDYKLFQKRVTNDKEAIEALSLVPFFPNGKLVNRKELFGFANEDVNGMLRTAKSFMVSLDR